jgi:hypothetical protein
MVSINRFDRRCSVGLLAATPPGQRAGRVPTGWLKEGAPHAKTLDTVALDPTFERAADGYAQRQYDWISFNAFMRKLLGNARVVRFLAEHHPNRLSELESLIDR